MATLKSVTLTTLPDILIDGINQSFEFLLDELTGRWIGNLTVYSSDGNPSYFEINTTRNKRKTWVHLDGCINFVLDIAPHSEITIKIKRANIKLTLISK